MQTWAGAATCKKEDESREENNNKNKNTTPAHVACNGGGINTSETRVSGKQDTKEQERPSIKAKDGHQWIVKQVQKQKTK